MVLDCEPAGIRICGMEGCPPLRFEGCPGVGCTETADRDTGALLAGGICWPDIDEFANASCTVCPDGQACAHRADGGLICVPFEVCAELYETGSTEACRYADKSPFTNEPFATGGTCLPSTPQALCGNECDCVSAYGCTGRSATQPLGVCIDPLTDGDGCTAADPTTCFESLQYCAIFNVDGASQGVADKYGFCLDQERCLVAAAAGVVSCYDHQGKL